MDERRQLPRWRIKREARIKLSKSNELSSCMIEDMNLKGMKLSLLRPLPQEQCIKMSLIISDSFGLDIEAEVPWRGQIAGLYTYGLSFSKILDTDKQRVYEYICANCSEQFKDKWFA